MLAHLQGKWQDDAEKMSIEEKKKHRDMLMGVLRMVNTMRNDLKKSMDDSGHEGMVLQMRGHFPFGQNGSVLVPTKDEVQAAFYVGVCSRDPIGVKQADVESVFTEENFNHIQAGPSSPNYLLREINMYVKFASVEQASLLLGGYKQVSIRSNENGRHCCRIELITPSRDAKTRATYRTIGSLIHRLKEVDNQLKALGAVAGNGGTPRLSKNLLQSDEFDAQVNECIKKDAKESLHGFLCTKTRVDKRKRQAAMDPLVDERINILLKLTKYDPDEVPFTFEREFK